MERYRVHTKPAAALAQAWSRYLFGHVAEVALAGNFIGAEVTAAGEDARVVDYSAPGGAVQRYLESWAPKFREDAETRFPAAVEKSREISPLLLRVSAPFSWETLGLVNSAGLPVPCPSNGPFRLVYWAPWCGDCQAMWPALIDDAGLLGERVAFVGIYSSHAQRAEFLAERQPPRLDWSEPSEKTETARARSFHAVLRQLSGDSRRWGVPVWHDLWIEDGRFVVRWT